MSRSLRLEFPGALYHVMSRGVARMATFWEDEDREDFLRRLGDLVRARHLAVHAFCLMPNHYHLLTSTPQGGLSRWMRHVNGDYVRAFNVRYRRVGHLWQGRYKAILVGDGMYAAECSRYIHLNPNRAQITRPAEPRMASVPAKARRAGSGAERYRWSSYRNYVGGPRTVDWVETGRVLAEFGGDRKRYRAYVEAGKGEKPVSPFERAAAGVVLGTQAFVAKIGRLLEKRPKDREVPSLGAMARLNRPSPEAIEAAVEEEFRGQPPRRRRRLKMVALRKHSALTSGAIARRYGHTPAAVPVAVKTVGSEADRSPALARRLSRLAERLREA